MAQIQAGVTYANGGQVNATNLNAHVNNAVLVPGAINDQTAAASCTTSDSVLILQSGALKKATLTQVQTSIAPDLSAYVNRNGSVAMTGELTLSSSTPSAALSAASKGYVDTGLATKQATIGYTPANKAGDTFTGAVVLNADPSVALGAATKQYVDAAVAPKANLSGATFTGSVVLQADPAVALGAATKQYVDTQTSASNLPAGAIMAFYRNAAPTGWLECNGQSAAAYPNLVALGIITVPDLRGEFVRGWDNGKGTDPGRALGSTQAGMVGPHTHVMNGFTATLSAGGTAAICDPPGGGGSAITKDTAANTGTETRPRNIALMYCIKT
jgi:hypothetical protein